MDSFAAEKGGERGVGVLGGWWTGWAGCWVVGWLAAGRWLVGGGWLAGRWWVVGVVSWLVGWFCTRTATASFLVLVMPAALYINPMMLSIAISQEQN